MSEPSIGIGQKPNLKRFIELCKAEIAKEEFTCNGKYTSYLRGQLHAYERVLRIIEQEEKELAETD